ncbi:MAG: hypothetical protein JSS10_07445 [Verrucomicrobia bacterium]|nr:hypothetical protein [Verrucomicrobiota bacterium]
MAIRIFFPKTEADYESIDFQGQSARLGYHYLTAQLTRRDGKQDTVQKIFYDNTRVDSTSPMSDAVYKVVASVLDKKDDKYIDIDRTKGIVSIYIKKV